MPRDLGSTTISFQARTEQFNRSLNRARRRLRAFGREARSAGKTASLVFAGLTFGGAATIKRLTDSATALRELSIASGIGVPRLQELQRVFESDGLAAEQFNKAILRLNRTIGDAAAGEIEYLEAFEGLGIDLRNAQGEIRSTDDLLVDIVSSLAQLPPALQASFGNDIFGRAFQSMSTSFARLGENADAFNEEIARQAQLLPTLTDAAAIELKAVNQAFTDAGNAAQTYGQILVASIGPEIVSAIEGALRAIKDNADAIARGFQLIVRNADLIAGVGLALIFRRIAVSVGLATFALLKFATVGIIGLVSGGAGSLTTLVASMKSLGIASIALVKPLALAAAGITALWVGIRYVQQILAGDGFGLGNLFDTLKDDVTGLYERITSLFSGLDADIPGVTVPIDIENPTNAIDNVNNAIENAAVPTIEIRTTVDDFGLKEQLAQLERQRDLLKTTGNATVELAARQQYLSNINQEVSSTYDELNSALDQLASGGSELTALKTAELESQVSNLQAKIAELNAQAINPSVNQEFFDNIVRVNQEIATLEGERQAQVSIDVEFELGGSLDRTRAELEAEIALLGQASRGEISFGVAEIMKEEVNTAIGELDALNNRIAENERLLNLQPDVNEAARLNAELLLLRERAQNIELMVVDPSSIQAASEEVAGLQNQLESYRRSQEFASSVANSFTSSLRGIINGSKSGSDAVKSFILSLADLVLQYTVLIPLAQSLSFALGGAFGGIGGGITGLATGGFGRGLTLVGERGPELVDLGSGSRVYNNDQLADAVGGGGGGVSVTNNISIDSTDGPGVRRALAEALPAITDASVNRIMSESSRPGQVRTVMRGY